MSRCALLCVALVAIASPAAAQTSATDLHARRAISPPKLDGVLDDEVWSGEPMPLEPWVSYNPLRGERAQQATSVWVAYDEDAIYFAFRCLDPEPARIRTTISRRDNVWSDDWVAVSLDSSRAGQLAYHMFVNPSGIQMDALQTADREDTAPDWVWQSAGRVDERGYVIEIRVPLESIRFRGGSDVRMGVL
ncbi:MAG: carbohydrate binding family 9 domain-containing protein, partial [bacterium]